MVDAKSWPVILDTDDMPKKKLAVQYRAPTAEMLAYLDFRFVHSHYVNNKLFVSSNT